MKVYATMNSNIDGCGVDDFLTGVVGFVHTTLEGAKQTIEKTWEIDDGEKLVWRPEIGENPTFWVLELVSEGDKFVEQVGGIVELELYS